MQTVEQRYAEYQTKRKDDSHGFDNRQRDLKQDRQKGEQNDQKENSQTGTWCVGI